MAAASWSAAVPGGELFSLQAKLLAQGLAARTVGKVRLIKRHFPCPPFKTRLGQKFQADHLRGEKLARVIINDLHRGA